LQHPFLVFISLPTGIENTNTMHSALNRLQAVFGFFTTVAFCVAGLAAFTTLWYSTEDVSSSVALTDAQVYVLSALHKPFIWTGNTVPC
jgi:hypothetical protein